MRLHTGELGFAAELTEAGTMAEELIDSGGSKQMAKNSQDCCRNDRADTRGAVSR
jgi:hypothetical protein